MIAGTKRKEAFGKWLCEQYSMSQASDIFLDMAEVEEMYQANKEMYKKVIGSDGFFVVSSIEELEKMKMVNFKGLLSGLSHYKWLNKAIDIYETFFKEEVLSSNEVVGDSTSLHHEEEFSTTVEERTAVDVKTCIQEIVVILKKYELSIRRKASCMGKEVLEDNTVSCPKENIQLAKHTHNFENTIEETCLLDINYKEMRIDLFSLTENICLHNKPLCLIYDCQKYRKFSSWADFYTSFFKVVGGKYPLVVEKLVKWKYDTMEHYILQKRCGPLMKAPSYINVAGIDCVLETHISFYTMLHNIFNFVEQAQCKPCFAVLYL